MKDHYDEVVKKRREAKYLACKHISGEKIDYKLKDSWDTHRKLSSKFTDYYFDQLNKKIESNSKAQISEVNFLDYKINLIKELLESCELCQHKCRINRLKGELGFCNTRLPPYVSSYFLHTGEEKILIPSGTIFFSGCTFRCAYSTHKVNVYA